ncbi:MAG: MATE family efflux transporter [Bacteroidota bacterium]
MKKAGKEAINQMIKTLITNIRRILLPDDMILLLKLAIPIIGSSLLHMTYNLTDLIWVGRLGSGATASVGTAGFFMNLGWAMASIITMGVGVKIAHAVGARDDNEAGRFAASGMHGIGALALGYSLILLFGAPFLIQFFNLEDQQVIADAVTYLRINSFSMIFMLFGLLFINIINAHGYTKLSFKVSLTGTLLNIVLDPLLIHTFQLGVPGAAYATLTARMVTLLVAIFVIQRQNKIHFADKKLSYPHLRKILKIGVPTSMQRVAFVLIYILLARIIAEWGAVAIAVQKVGVQIESLTFMFTGGLTQAMAIAVGQQYGANNLTRIKGIYTEGQKLALGIGAASTLLFLSVPEFLFSIFLTEPESIRMGANYLRILAVSQIFMCLEMITAGAFNGMGRTDIPAKVSILFTSLRIPAAYLLGFYTLLGLNGVWWSISGTSLFKGVILYILFRKIFGKMLNTQNQPTNESIQVNEPH